MPNVVEIFNLIETRLISGKGLFEFSYNPAYRAFRLFTQIVRPPITNYPNYKWNPSKDLYAYISWNADNYVIRDDKVEFDGQRFDWVVDPGGDASHYAVCAQAQIINYFDYLAPFVSAPPLVDDPTKKIFFTPLSYYFDKILIQCREETALSCDLWGLKYNTDCPDAAANPPPKPAAPPKLPKLPPSTPIGNISPPYNPATNDDGNTAPYGTDANPSEPCVSIVRGAGINNNDCTKLGDQGDYSYNGYVQLVATTSGPNNCPGLQVYLDGVSLGPNQIYYPDAVVITRTGNCVPPT